MEAARAKPAAAAARIESIDLLRGAVMVVMALDHARDFFGALPDPEALDRTWPALFATRWITHFCAPVFSLLAGLGAALQRERGRPAREVAGYLASRGLFLIALEVVYMQALWSGSFAPIYLSTLWALGVSMIALAGLSFLPARVVALIAVAIVAGHDLLDGVHADRFGRWGLAWSMLHEMSFGPRLGVIYPVLPWIGVMALGFAMGPMMSLAPERRRRALVASGLAMTAAFLALRATNLYGDPSPWSAQLDAVHSALSFLRVSKYPPSLQFILATLGPSLVALALLDRFRPRPGNVLLAFGRAPMFFYLAHALVLPALVFAVLALRGEPRWPGLATGLGAGGLSLAGVYAVWIAVVALLYWPTRAFGEYKRAHPERAWLRYL